MNILKNKLFLAWAIVVSKLGDALTTYVGVLRHGPHIEANPVVLTSFDWIGIVPTLLLMTFWVWGWVWFLHKAFGDEPKRFFWIYYVLLGMHVGVVINNLIVLTMLG